MRKNTVVQLTCYLSRLMTYAFAGILTLLLASCGTAGNQNVLVVGYQYENLITVGAGGTQVPLPAGAWRLVGSSHYAGHNEIAGVLIQTEDGRVSQLIDFYVPFGPGSRGRLLYEFCGRNDVIHMGQSTRSGRATYTKGLGWERQRCWGLNHWPMTFSGRVPDHLLALRDYLDKNGLELPITMIAAQYRRSGDGKFMSLNYYFNPELEGFAPPKQIDWLTNDWHRDRYARDPEKKTYIEKLIKWGEAWNEQVDKGFKGVLR